jgi:uncharacterized membrane protein (GlpM family)
VDYLLRFLIGGAVVSMFAVLGDVLRPKSFAGLFGAAPSVALATLGLAFWKHGAEYVAIEAHSMMLGAVAFAAYSIAACQLLVRADWPALRTTSAAAVVWLAVAMGLERLLIG